MERVRLGVLILPDAPWVTAQATWRRAEALGFDHAWTYDHIAWRSLRDSPWFASVPTLTAAAMVTTRIRLGPLVASPNFRHPVPFGRELLSLDDVSGGRLVLGFGAGAIGWDATALGNEPWSRRERAERFAEFVALLDRLLRRCEVHDVGRHYGADTTPLEPGCVQQPRLPFAIAATGPKGLAVVAAHGQTWVTNGDRSYDGAPLDAVAGAEVVRRQAGALEQACHAAGRDPATIDRLVLAGVRLDGGLHSVEAFRDTIGRYEEVGVTDFVLHWPRAEEPFAGDLASFERIVSSVTGGP